MNDLRPGGFITLHHQFWTSPDLSGLRAAHLHVFVTILHLANWRASHFWAGAKRIDVARGEFTHSIKAIAAEARATEREVRTTLDNLLARGLLQHKNATDTDTRVRVLRVVNYEKYQGLPERPDTKNATPPPDDRQTTATPPSPSEQDQPDQPTETLSLREAGSEARQAIESLKGQPPHPLTDAVVLGLRGKGIEPAYPANGSRASVEAAIREVGVPTAVVRIAAAWDTAQPWLTFYLQTITGRSPAARSRPPTNVNAPAPIGTQWGGPPPF